MCNTFVYQTHASSIFSREMTIPHSFSIIFPSPLSCCKWHGESEMKKIAKFLLQLDFFNQKSMWNMGWNKVEQWAFSSLQFDKPLVLLRLLPSKTWLLKTKYLVQRPPKRKLGIPKNNGKDLYIIVVFRFKNKYYRTLHTNKAL